MKFYAQAQALINSMRTDEEGATAVEYGLMVSLIAVAIIATVSGIAVALNSLFTGVATSL